MKRILTWWKELNIKWVSNNVMNVLSFISAVACVIYYIYFAVEMIQIRRLDKEIDEACTTAIDDDEYDHVDVIKFEDIKNS